MNTSLLLTLFALGAFSTSLHSEIFPVSLDVDTITKTESTKRAKSQKRSLRIWLINDTTTELSKLSVKFYLFGREVDQPDILMLEHGDKLADIKPRSTEMIETATFTATVTKGKPSKTKRVHDKGFRFTGYGVQVFDPEKKLLGEFFSSPMFKVDTRRD